MNLIFSNFKTSSGLRNDALISKQKNNSKFFASSQVTNTSRNEYVLIFSDSDLFCFCLFVCFIFIPFCWILGVIKIPFVLMYFVYNLTSVDHQLFITRPSDVVFYFEKM